MSKNNPSNYLDFSITETCKRHGNTGSPITGLWGLVNGTLQTSQFLNVLLFGAPDNFTAKQHIISL